MTAAQILAGSVAFWLSSQSFARLMGLVERGDLLRLHDEEERWGERGESFLQNTYLTLDHTLWVMSTKID
jgi:hypothetical protein